MLAPEGGRAGAAPRDFIVPVRTPAGDHALVLHADPRCFLDPLLRTGLDRQAPAARPLLLRAQPSQLRYPSAPRLQAGGQGCRPLPSVVEDAPAMQALRAQLRHRCRPGLPRRGRAGCVPAGRPFRLGAAGRVDEHEAWHLRPAHLRAGSPLMALLSTGVLVAVALATWRQHRRNAQMAQTAQQQRLLEPFFHLPFIGMAVRSGSRRRWLRFNDRL